MDRMNGAEYSVTRAAVYIYGIEAWVHALNSYERTNNDLGDWWARECSNAQGAYRKLIETQFDPTEVDETPVEPDIPDAGPHAGAIIREWIGEEF